MADGHQECIYKGILDGIKKFGKDRINVQKDHRIDQCKCNEQTEKSFVHSSASGSGDPKIDKQNSSGEEHDDIDDGRLFEVLFERTEKAAGNIRFFVSCQLQCDIVDSCYGGACGDNRNTAEDAQKIQKKQVCYASHEHEEFVVHVEKTIHLISLLFFGILF